MCAHVGGVASYIYKKLLPLLIFLWSFYQASSTLLSLHLYDSPLHLHGLLGSHTEGRVWDIARTKVFHSPGFLGKPQYDA